MKMRVMVGIHSERLNSGDSASLSVREAKSSEADKVDHLAAQRSVRLGANMDLIPHSACRPSDREKLV